MSVIDGGKQISVGYDHNLSKRTTAYALYTKNSSNDVLGDEPSALSIGMKHTF